MPAYVIGIRHKLLDQKEMDAYSAAARATFAGKNIKVLARYGAHEDVESDPIDGLALIEFPTYQEALDWYHSDDYQKNAVPHRLKGGDYTVLIFDGAPA